MERLIKTKLKMEKGLFFTITEKSMKANLKMTLNKAKALSNFLMVPFILANLKKGKETEKEDFNGRMGKAMMDSGKIILNMAVVYGKAKIQLLLI